MYQLDEKNNGYTWNKLWINPYESVWNIGEKFFAANVSSNLYNVRTGVRGYGTRIYYCDRILVYSKGPLHSAHYDSYMQTLHNAFSIFSDMLYIILSELRYCPECAQQGYHSVFHQVSFIDKCFIHNKKLLFLCDCNDNYCLVWKKVSQSPFSCWKCDSKLPYPEIEDGIINAWHNKLKFKNINVSSEISHIYTIDIFYKNTGQRSHLSEAQKLLLNKILAGEKSNKFPSPVLTKHYEDDNKPLIFLAEKIQNYIIYLYGKEHCKKQFYLLDRYVRPENYKKFDFKVIAAFYLMGELMGESNLDRIYPVIFLGLSKEYDSRYNDLLQKATLFLQRNVSKAVRNYELTNYIYKKLAHARYKEIYGSLVSAEANSYPVNSYYIPITNIYPTYIVIEYKNGNMSLY